MSPVDPIGPRYSYYVQPCDPPSEADSPNGGVLLCGCPYAKSPTILGGMLGPRFLETSIYIYIKYIPGSLEGRKKAASGRGQINPAA